MTEKNLDVQKPSEPAKNGSNLGLYIIMGMFALAFVSIIVFSIVSKT